MSKAPKEKKVEVNGKKLIVKKPTSKEINHAKKVSNRVFSQALADPDILLIEQLDKILKEKGVWNNDKEAEFQTLNTEILELEKKLRAGGAKKSEGRAWSLDLMKKKGEREELTAGRLGFINATAEGQANEAYFAALVSQCVFLGPKKYFSSYEDYANAGDEEATESANALYELMSGGVEASTKAESIELQFLKRFNYIDDNMNFIDSNGNLVDADNRRIDEEGRFINEDNQFVNLNGDLVDAEGNLLVDESPWLDDEGMPILAETTEEVKTEKVEVKKAVPAE